MLLVSTKQGDRGVMLKVESEMFTGTGRVEFKQILLLEPVEELLAMKDDDGVDVGEEAAIMLAN